MKDTRNFGQRWADKATEFSGSWTFIFWFVGLCIVWVLCNTMGWVAFDTYPFMFLNWVLTVVSTFQNPLILLSQNRQNEMGDAMQREILEELRHLRREVHELRNR